MKYFISTILLLLVMFSKLKAGTTDSTRNMLIVHLSKRPMGSMVSFESLDGFGLFTNNSILSASVLLQRKVGHIKRFAVNGEMGLNFRYLKAGYKTSTMGVSSIKEDFTGTSFMVGMQFGLSIERKIITYKNNALFLSMGFAGTGIVFNSQNYYSQSFGQDSIELDFKANRLFYLNPYGQIRISSRLGKKDFLYGCRYLLGTDFEETNIFYSFYKTSYPNSYTHRGRLLDNRDQVSFFVGLTF